MEPPPREDLKAENTRLHAQVRRLLERAERAERHAAAWRRVAQWIHAAHTSSRDPSSDPD